MERKSSALNDSERQFNSVGNFDRSVTIEEREALIERSVNEQQKKLLFEEFLELSNDFYSLAFFGYYLNNCDDEK